MLQAWLLLNVGNFSHALAEYEDLLEGMEREAERQVRRRMHRRMHRQTSGEEGRGDDEEVPLPVIQRRPADVLPHRAPRVVQALRGDVRAELVLEGHRPALDLVHLGRHTQSLLHIRGHRHEPAGEGAVRRCDDPADFSITTMPVRMSLVKMQRRHLAKMRGRARRSPGA